MLVLDGEYNCVNGKFSAANEQFDKIAARIKNSCAYQLFPDELLATQQLAEENRSHLSREFKEMRAEFAVIIAKEKMDVMEECKAEAVKEIAKHVMEEGKLSGQMMTLQSVYLSLVDRLNDQQGRLLVLEKKD